MLKRTLEDILIAAGEGVEVQKTARLRRILEEAFGRTADEIPFGDPIHIRMQMVRRLNVEGTSKGIIQSYEQLFMGFVRRAAVKRLIPPPPEGPWSLNWQHTIDRCPGERRMRALLRSLAGWASMNGLEPSQVSKGDLRKWQVSTAQSLQDELCCSILAFIGEAPNGSSGVNLSTLSDRLQKKATTGTVRTDQVRYNAHARKRSNLPPTGVLAQ